MPCQYTPQGEQLLPTSRRSWTTNRSERGGYHERLESLGREPRRHEHTFRMNPSLGAPAHPTSRSHSLGGKCGASPDTSLHGSQRS